MRQDQGPDIALTARPSMKIVRWKGGKQHVSTDGIKTICSSSVPSYATIVRETPDWHLYTNCYNCAHRLWPDHGPEGYIQPANGRDFPLRKFCPHGKDPGSCVECTPSAAQNWPCPRGCTDPRDHDPWHRYTRCTVRPPKRPSSENGRCIDECETTDRAMHRANPGFSYDLADSASMHCYHCGGPVCIECQRTPMDDLPGICDAHPY